MRSNNDLDPYIGGDLLADRHHCLPERFSSPVYWGEAYIRTMYMARPSQFNLDYLCSRYLNLDVEEE